VWKLLAIPPICERLIGFSIPREGNVLVISYEAAHLMRLRDPVEIVHEPQAGEYAIYDPEAGIADFHGTTYSIVGLHGGSPLLTSPQGEQLQLDTVRERLIVTKEGGAVLDTAYENFSGDWAAATFSPDGRFIVLGCPNDMDLRVWERVTA
jgi:hypothetical protein